MEQTISFTPSQIIAFVLALCGAICTISAAVGVFVKALDRAKAPEKAQDIRLDNLEAVTANHEERLNRYAGYFDNDDKRFIAMDKSNRITQSALLALLKNAINGSDTEDLEKAQKELEEFLLSK